MILTSCLEGLISILAGCNYLKNSEGQGLMHSAEHSASSRAKQIYESSIEGPSFAVHRSFILSRYVFIHHKLCKVLCAVDS